MLKRILVVMIVLLVLSALFAITAAAQGTGDPANGKTQWAARNCKSCHGDNGEGKYAGPLRRRWPGLRRLDQAGAYTAGEYARIQHRADQRHGHHGYVGLHADFAQACILHAGEHHRSGGRSAGPPVDCR